MTCEVRGKELTVSERMKLKVGYLLLVLISLCFCMQVQLGDMGFKLSNLLKQNENETLLQTKAILTQNLMKRIQL